jgi:hypothetical protein
MSWYEWLAVIAFLVCILSCIYHTYTLIRLGNPPEYARRSGHIGKAVRYSFIGAMSPKVKESAYLHMPTYTAGILYHLGTFIAILFFFLIPFQLALPGYITYGMATLLILSGLSGIGILLKRIFNHELRSLSNPDDFISNLLVDLFQFSTALILLQPGNDLLYYLTAALLLFYFPLGKLKHAVYFFAARYHLGFFYGWRNVWPPKTIKK